jgi:hypothetical protein
VELSKCFFTISDFLNLEREDGWESSGHIDRESNKERKEG